MLEEINDHQWIVILIPIIHFVRRLLIGLTLVLSPSNFWVQLATQMFVSSAFIILVGWVQPFDSRLANRMEMFTECVTLGTLYLLLVFTDFVPLPETRYSMGFVFIALIMIFAAVHIGVLVKMSYLSLRSYIIKKYVRR